MDDLISQNPYNPQSPLLPDGFTLTAYIASSAALARLHQHIADAVPGALMYLGRGGVGKTALVLNAGGLFGETVLCVPLLLKEAALNHEADLLRLLYNATAGTLEQQGFTLSRLTPIPDDNDTLRDWLLEVGFPQLFGILRTFRHLVLLLDDIDLLISAIQRESLPADMLAYLGRVANQPQMTMVLTAQPESETHLPLLLPLVEHTAVYRLENLTLEETALLLRVPAEQAYTVRDDAAAAIYAATGGVPRLVQIFGYFLYARWLRGASSAAISAAEIKALLPRAQEQAELLFRDLWQSRNSSERLVLTAAAGLIYEDPLRPLKPEQITVWLLQTDYPLDTTAVNAALRSLEYDQLIRTTGGKVTFYGGMWQTWLLENARLRDAAGRPSGRRRARAVLLAAVLFVLVVALVLAITLSSAPPTSIAPQPTVTLVGTPGE